MNNQLLTEIINLPTTRGWANKPENKALYEWVFQQTDHLPKRAQLIQRAWTLLHGKTKCKECDKPVSTWDVKNRRYVEFCSAACKRSFNKKITIEPLKLEVVVEWCNNNNVESGLPYSTNPRMAHSIVHYTNFLPQDASASQRKYHILQNIDSIPMCLQCDEKHVSWCGEGGRSYYTFCSQKCSAIHNDTREARRRTSVERFGNDYIQVLQDRASIAVRAKYNGRMSTAQKHIPIDVLDKLNDPAWLTTEHHDNQRTLSSISDTLNVDLQTVIRYINLHQIAIMRFGSSEPERDICSLLSEWGVDYIQNDRSILDGHELDIVIPDAKIAIEYCGLYWHADIHSRIDKNYHANKLNRCNEKGLRLITIFEDEWIGSRELVISKLKSILGLGQGSRVFARKTEVVSVSTPVAKTFHNNNHIQGYGSSSISYGLKYDDTIVAVLSFKRKCANDWYLTRYSTSGSVVGGFQKLLKHFESNVEWSSIITFADRRWSEGDLYHKSEFDLDCHLPPDYYYIQNGKRVHKFNYRRKYLPLLLEDFDPNLSERENCDRNGVLRIWNCGLLRFVKTNKKGCL